MKKDVNQILKEQFLKEFNYAKRMAEVEGMQQPFWNIAIIDPNGNVLKKIKVCFN